MSLGTAFQVVDDLLDFTETEEALGKPTGVDLLEGKLTLPLIFFLESEPAARASLQRVMQDGGYYSLSRAEVLRMLESSGALARARQCAYAYAQAARVSLETLPDSEYCDALRTIPSYIIERNR